MASSSAAISPSDENWRYIKHPKMGPSKILHIRLGIDPGYVQSGVAVTTLCQRLSDKKLFFCSTVMERHDYKILYGNRKGMSCDALMKNIIEHYDNHFLPSLSRLYPLKKIKVTIESQFDASNQYQNNYANPSNVVAAALYGFFVGRGMEVEVVRADRKFGINEGLADWAPSRDTRKILATEVHQVIMDEWGVYHDFHKLFMLPADAPDEAYKDVHDCHDGALQAADSILTDNPDIDGATHFKDVIDKIRVIVAARRQKVSISEAAKARKRKARPSTKPKGKVPKAKRQKKTE